jgi:transcription elongation factor Elf1
VLFLVGLLALLVNVAIGHRRRYFDCPFCGQRIAAAVFAPHVSPSSRLSALFRVPDEVCYCPCCAASIDQEMPNRPDRADVGGENR